MKLFNIIEKMKDVRALVVGDAIVDNYIFGRVDRICPEAPVPVFVRERAESRMGGAAHVVEQMDALCRPSAVSLGTPVSVKTRYMVGNHLLLRVDADKAPLLDEEQKARALIDAISGAEVDVVVLSDYGKGWLSPSMCEFLMLYAVKRDVKVVVDPKGSDWSKYAGCDWICPNDKEMGDVGQVFAKRVLHKRGAHGLRIWFDGSGAVDFPATAKHVYDVTGAGDVVVAVFAAALAAGATDTRAAQLANLAAGWSVGEVGTAVCSRETLHALAKEYEHGES